MKIATYNVNGITSRLPLLLNWLKNAKPDLVCLQELKTAAGNFPANDLQKIGYTSYWNSEPRWNGVAILSKNMVVTEVLNILPGNENDHTCRFIEVQLQQIAVICVYVPNGNPYPSNKFTYKLNWLKHLEEYSSKLIYSKKPVIIAGDFNLIPEDRDVYHPERWHNDALFRPEVRKFYQSLLASGWTDALRKLYPERNIFTFFDYFRNALKRNAGMRIDHFFLNPVAAQKLQQGNVDLYVRSWPRTSDHCPVYITLDL